MKVLIGLALLAVLSSGCDRKEAEKKEREEKYDAAVGDTRKVLESRLSDWRAGKTGSDMLPTPITDKDFALHDKLRAATLIGYEIPSYLNNNSKSNTLWRTQLKFRGSDGKEFTQLMHYHVIGDSVEASAP